VEVLGGSTLLPRTAARLCLAAKSADLLALCKTPGAAFRNGQEKQP